MRFIKRVIKLSRDVCSEEYLNGAINTFLKCHSLGHHHIYHRLYHHRLYHHRLYHHHRHHHRHEEN